MFAEPTTGASSDIAQATKIARAMVTEYGMSAKLGAVKYGHGDDEPFLGRTYGSGPEYSIEVGSEIDGEVRALIEAAHTEAWAVLNTYRDILDSLASALLEKETLDRRDLEVIFAEVEKRPRITTFDEFGPRLPSDRPPIKTPGELAIERGEPWPPPEPVPAAVDAPVPVGAVSGYPGQSGYNTGPGFPQSGPAPMSGPQPVAGPPNWTGGVLPGPLAPMPGWQPGPGPGERSRPRMTRTRHRPPPRWPGQLSGCARRPVRRRSPPRIPDGGAERWWPERRWPELRRHQRWRLQQWRSNGGAAHGPGPSRPGRQWVRNGGPGDGTPDDRPTSAIHRSLGAPERSAVVVTVGSVPLPVTAVVHRLGAVGLPPASHR